jgi:hydrogenase maturation protease
MILLIAYGNDLRRDDGAGFALAEMIEQAWRTRPVAVKQIAVHQLTPELAADIAGPDITGVIFLDARAVTPDEVNPAVQIQPLHYDSASPGLGHYLDPTALLLYAGRLYNRQPPAWLVTVPGTDFGYGEGLSPATQQALADARTLPDELLARLPASLPETDYSRPKPVTAWANRRPSSSPNLLTGWRFYCGSASEWLGSYCSDISIQGSGML